MAPITAPTIAPVDIPLCEVADGIAIGVMTASVGDVVGVGSVILSKSPSFRMVECFEGPGMTGTSVVSTGRCVS